MKRAVSVLMCVVLLLAALPFGVTAAPAQKLSRQELTQQIHDIYLKCREDAQVESFAGYCGLLTSHQLHIMGIDAYLRVCDGNKQYEAYAGREFSTGGYRIKTYSAEEFTLEQALNAITLNGTLDAQNILVCFEATNTDAGSSFGHALVIHEIRDGVAYFVENYETYLAGEEGNVLALTISQVGNFYKDWTLFEGVVHFGEKIYTDGCQQFPTDLFLRSRFATTLRSEPCIIGQNDCVRLRNVVAGELLRATGVMKNTHGELYYLVEDGLQTGYVAANAVGLLEANAQSVTVEELSAPQWLKPGSSGDISGKITAAGDLGTVSVIVTDEAGNVALEQSRDMSGSSCTLQQLNRNLAFSKLAEGSYTVSLKATASYVVVKGNALQTQQVEQELYCGSLVVSQEQPQEAELQSRERAAVTQKNGWLWQDGTLYCYENGSPCTGWMYHLGVVYYLKEDGSVTTGFAEVDGQPYCFSATGALYKGWVVTPEGSRYWHGDGRMATFWQQIDEALYYFGADGLLVTEGIVAAEDGCYRIAKDGKATVLSTEPPPEPMASAEELGQPIVE